MSKKKVGDITNKIGYCSLCKRNMIICTTCGNNTCNGGYGTIGDKLCTDCPKAYEEDKMMFGDKDMR